MARPPKSFLKDTHPDLAAQVVDKSLLDKLATGSNMSIEWECEHGHRWFAKVYNRTGKSGTGCPICNGKQVLRGYNDLATTRPDIAKLCLHEEDAYTHTENSNKKIEWRCEKGHVWTAPVSRITVQGSGCPYCSGRLAIPGETDLATAYPELAAELVDQSLGSVLKPHSNAPVLWRCAKGHEYRTAPYNRVDRGSGCPYCSGRNAIVGESDLATVAPEYAATLVNPEVAKTVSKDSSKKLEWICQNNPNHRWFSTPTNRLKSDVMRGCPVCDNKKVVVGENDLVTTHPQIAKELVHSEDGTRVTAGSGIELEWKCDVCGKTWVAAPYHRTGNGATGCPHCDTTGTSKAEQELFEWVQKLLPGETVLPNDQTVLPGKFELDIVVPSRHIAIEYNGCRWHSEVCGKSETYHLDKYLQCKQAGYDLVQVWEDDWVDNRLLVLRAIARKLGVLAQLVKLERNVQASAAEHLFADDFIAGEVSGEIVSMFLRNNYLGKIDVVDKSFALFDSFGSVRAMLCLRQVNQAGKGVLRNWEIAGYVEVGVFDCGFDKLLEYAQNTLDEQGTPVRKWIARSWNESLGTIDYEACGFSFVGDVKPDYTYVGNRNKWHRMPKELLSEEHFANADSMVWSDVWSEHETALANGFYRLYDAGSKQWERVVCDDAHESGVLHLVEPTDVSLTQRAISRYVRYYQQDVFYAAEKKLWFENDEYRGMPLRTYLFNNREQYLGKSSAEISDVELLRGFRISGIYRGYTVFDTKLMAEVVEKYDIKRIYDPCAGWGERLLWCFAHDVEYEGVDINAALAPGYRAMADRFGITCQTFAVDDGSKHNPGMGYDAVLTCPPYGDTEIYSDAGAENLSYRDFVAWWSHVVKKSVSAKPTYFCFQVNTRYRDVMADVVVGAGYHLVDELFFGGNKHSHFLKAKGANKTSKESMLVFARN